MSAWQSTINNIIVSRETILSAENSGKPLGGRAPPQTRSQLGGGELTALPQRPQYNLSVESNQNVESKRQTVESKMEK